jgi:Domain of unknown function (DUF4728)
LLSDWNRTVSESDLHLIHRLLVFYAWLSIFGFSSSLLIFGAVKNRHTFLLPWLVVKLTVIAFGLVQLAYNCIHLNMQRLMMAPFQIGFSIIFWYVVYTFYLQLKNERTAFVHLVDDDGTPN